jgi:hypothetical protein
MLRQKIRLRPPRRVMVSLKPGTPGYQKQAQERYYRKLVADHTSLKDIIHNLAEGVAPLAIAKHYAQQGLIDVHENVFYKALLLFRKENHAAIQKQGTGSKLDAMISPKLAPLDGVSTAHQLLRLQKDRLAIAHAFEQTTNMPVQNVHRDIAEARELIEVILRTEGRAGGGGQSAKAMNQSFAPDVSENLEKLRRETDGGDALHNLTRELVKTHGDSDSS